jgi:hypothetical protein
MAGELKISFDLSEITKDFQVAKSQIPKLLNSVLNDVALAVHTNWREEANSKLHGTRAMYLRGLQMPVIAGKTATVALIGTVPNMLESGATAFDMKVGFKMSGKVTMKKDGKGWYITIPFRFATSGAVGESEAFSGKMPQSVNDIAQGLKGKQQIKEPQLPKNLQGVRGVRKEVKGERKVYGAYTHKSNIYSGITKKVAAYGQTTQSKYMSFRRVSDLSDPDAFIHPGFTARDFATKAVDKTNVQDVMALSTESFLTSVGL